ncbi:MAG: NAAT family transporter, partial [Buchnera aphidicola]|nr:NAAT family transporter [Buchnera aphidicola]MDE5285765.1 NAAT family transporter [Buchnera aphidicola]
MNISIFDMSIYIKFFISLCALVNPIGMIPIFTSITSNQNVLEKAKTNLIANSVAALILLISLLIGNNILNIFGISINSFRIAGGMLIISIAYSMINGAFANNIKSKKSNTIENISV